MTMVALSRNSQGEPVLRCEVVPTTGFDSFPPVDSLQLPASPADITPTWGPDVSPAAKELAWQLLKVFKEARHWGEIAESAELSMHLLADSRRPNASRVGFRHFPLKGESDWELLAGYRAASLELANGGYLVRSNGNRRLAPTMKLAACAVR